LYETREPLVFRRERLELSARLRKFESGRALTQRCCRFPVAIGARE